MRSLLTKIIDGAELFNKNTAQVSRTKQGTFRVTGKLFKPQALLIEPEILKGLLFPFQIEIQVLHAPKNRQKSLRLSVISSRARWLPLSKHAISVFEPQVSLFPAEEVIRVGMARPPVGEPTKEIQGLSIFFFPGNWEGVEFKVFLRSKSPKKNQPLQSQPLEFGLN